MLPPPASFLEDLGGGITLIDTGYGRPAMDACYLLADRGEAAFIDTGTARNCDRLLAALGAASLPPAAVRYVILTHVHLDHAAGAGLLLASLPNASLVVHPRGAPHVIDPARLVAGASAVYGAARLRALFGEIRPVDPARVTEADDGAVLELGRRQLRCLDTPGHARHHLAVADPAGDALFAGDTFGLCYRELHGPHGPFVLPTTSPVQFDPDALHASVARIADTAPGRVLVTHFGAVGGIARLAAAMHRRIDALTRLARHVQGADAEERLVTAIEQLASEELASEDNPRPLAEIRRVLGPDILLNAQGLLAWRARSG